MIDLGGMGREERVAGVELKEEERRRGQRRRKEK